MFTLLIILILIFLFGKLYHNARYIEFTFYCKDTETFQTIMTFLTCLQRDEPERKWDISYSITDLHNGIIYVRGLRNPYIFKKYEPNSHKVHYNRIFN